jgi:hypothetical protein
VRAGSLHEERQEPSNPTIDGASVDHDAPFGESLRHMGLRHIGIAEPVADVPPDGKSADLIGVAAAEKALAERVVKLPQQMHLMQRPLLSNLR